MSQPILIDVIAALGAVPAVEGEVPAADATQFAELLETVDPELAEPLLLEEFVPAESPTADVAEASTEATPAPAAELAPEPEAAQALETLPVLVSQPEPRNENRPRERDPAPPRAAGLPREAPAPEVASIASRVPASASGADPRVVDEPAERTPPAPRAPTAAPAADRAAPPSELPAAERAELRELPALPRLPDAPNPETALAQADATTRAARETGEVRERILPELPARNESEILEQTRVLVERGGGRVRIELRPPSLGELGIRVVVQERAVAIEFVAERAGVAELLSQQLPALRHALESHGLDIDRLEVGARAGDRESEPEARTANAEDRDGRQPPSLARQKHDDATAAEDWTPLQHGGISLGTVDLRV